MSAMNVALLVRDAELRDAGTTGIDRLRSAMTSALQDAQIGAPRPDRFTILVSHHAG